MFCDASVKVKNRISSEKIIVTHEFAPFRGGVATYCAEVARAAGADVIAAPRSSLRLGALAAFASLLLRERQRLEGARVILGSVGAQLVFMHLHAAGLLRGVDAAPLFHGSEPLRYRRNPWLRWLARRWLAQRPRLFAASGHARKVLLESGLVSKEATVKIAPCAVRSDLQAEAERTPLPMPDPQGRLRILTLARVHPRKGQLDTARALASLPNETKRGIVYQIGGAGDPAYLREVEAACVAGGVPFEYLGEISEDGLARAYAACDLYVMASRTLPRSVEGFGLTYLEAGLFGKPVVAARSGGVEEAVLDGKTGLLVPEGDIPAQAEALRKLIEDAALRRTLGEGNRTHALSRKWDEAARVLFGD
jgi:phosphatidylinositol alpha-1,6-mannosyltransferase